MHPLVSVVMSVYNGERFLREAVDSILNQTFSDFELIIINDGSTDETREILESYKDERLVLVDQENMGLTKALNNGIARAKGKYVARQDADDVSKPERLEKQVAFMEAHPAVGLLGTRFEFIDQNGMVTRQGVLPIDNRALHERLKVINQFNHGSVMIRKEALDKVGLFRDFFKYAQDYDLWLRIAEQYEVCNLPECLFCYRELEKAISSSKILTQSLYAGIAAEMGLQRRETGSDALQNGTVPEMPPVQRLSRELHEKLIDFYSQNPRVMLDGLHANTTDDKDLVYLFEKICEEMRQGQVELRKRNEIISRLDTRTQQIVSEQMTLLQEAMRVQFTEAVIRNHREELRQRDEIVRQKDDAAIQLQHQINELTEQLRKSQEKIYNQNGDIIHRDGRISQMQDEFVRFEHQRLELEQQLVQKAVETADRDARIRLIGEEIVKERIKWEAERAHLLKERATERQEFERLNGEMAQRIRDMEQVVAEREQSIVDLLNSKSWKITAPLRKTLDLFSGKSE